MSSSRVRWFLACVLVCEGLLGGSAVLAQSITFRRVVDTNTPIPGGTGNFTVLDRRPSMRGGNVAFLAEGTGGQIGVYTEIGGVLGLVADTNTAIPGGTGSFIAFATTTDGSVSFSSNANVSFDGVNVVFRGTGSSAQNGIYTDGGGTLRVVADTNTPIPGGTGNFVGFLKNPSIDSGNIAFAGGDTPMVSPSSAADGVYTEIDGVLSVVADTSTPVPGESATYTSFDYTSLDGTDTAFRAISIMSTSVIGLVTRIDDVFKVVMDVNTPIPGDTGTFNVFGVVNLDSGNVVVLGGKDAFFLTGVYTDLGGTLRVVADKNTPVPGGMGNFTDFFFGPVAAIDNGNIAFMGASRGTTFFTVVGMYAEMQGSLIKIADSTDTLGTDILVGLSGGPEALGGNEVAFLATFADGSEAIFVATIPLGVCGNGILEMGEECDDQGESANCSADCTLTECGNGIVDAGEECDDGNTISDDGCRTDCTLPRCGDGILDPGEGCDDGNTVGGDFCRADCSRCGDGTVDPGFGEECDDGNLQHGDGCQANCQLPACGDFIVDAGETCDDGNTIDGDGCQSDCLLPACGDGILDSGEQCDDGNTINGDGCQSDCLLPACGDGIVDAGEACDDGNIANGDGCSSTCEVEDAGETVPTVSQWGLMVMGLLLGIGGKVYFRRRRQWQRLA